MKDGLSAVFPTGNLISRYAEMGIDSMADENTESAPERLVVGGALSIPRFSPNGFNVMASPTEITVVCTAQVPGMSAGGFQLGALPVATLGLSIVAAKELCAILGDVVANAERAFGTVTSEFLNERAARP